MSMKRWVVGSADRETAKLLAEECDTDPFCALVATSRGITDSSELELLLSDEPLLCDPYELVDIKKAADYINEAIIEKRKIAVFGDYDCDGIVATAILCDYLRSRGADVLPYIPDRLTEGYGMNMAAVDTLKEKGIELIITVDNGISCYEEIRYAEEQGILTVVTDHHLPPEKLPEAVAVVNPHRVDCPSQFKEVCGAQVAFKLVCVLDDKEPEQMLSRYADILSVAVVGDVMPLINENRCIVKQGIKKIKHSPSVAIAAILNMAGIDRKEMNSGRISFGIVPRINAAGRMGSAYDALELLLCTDTVAALKIAADIDDKNTARQQIEKEIAIEAIRTIEEKGYQYDRVIVVSGQNWHSGVVGIVASRICERYGKPAVVLSIEGDLAHGSARSIGEFNLYNAVESASDCLVKFGGHSQAAGMTLKAENIELFRESINKYALNLEAPHGVQKIDFKINPAGMSVDMVYAIKQLEPFGFGNPAPVFGIFGPTIQKITPVGNGKHLKLLLSRGDNAFQAILFSVSAERFGFGVGDVVDLAVALDVNIYRDEPMLSVQIKDIRLSSTDEDRLFCEIDNFDMYMSGNSFDADMLCPSREQVGIIYREIAKGNITAERIKYMFLGDIGFGKAQVALNTLCELGLVREINGALCINKAAAKTDLLNSKSYSELRKKVNADE